MDGRIVPKGMIGMLGVVSIMLAGCTQAADVGPGAARPTAPAVQSPLYAPIDRTALAFGLPDLVQGRTLLPSPHEVVALDEQAFAQDLLVKPQLVARGLSARNVSIEQKGDRLDAVPTVATSGVWVRGIPAETFAEFDPSFYLLLTSVTPTQYRWEGEKPGRDRATILGRTVWLSDWGRFKVVWYTWGEVLYIVLAQNDQLLEATLQQMPLPPEAA